MDRNPVQFQGPVRKSTIHARCHQGARWFVAKINSDGVAYAPVWLATEDEAVIYCNSQEDCVTVYGYANG